MFFSECLEEDETGSAPQKIAALPKAANRFELQEVYLITTFF